ncbi:hypothetical protein WG66_016170 [Moniliophthora roreri]|uniref:Microtubule associated protein n=1 Tax=Moniliophthora roreri TaxID=221103 RepID=A0A0W0EXV9_MONRR|nr:hypothetical protein WG66_016170 [Moniliophthora roreri]
MASIHNTEKSETSRNAYVIRPAAYTDYHLGSSQSATMSPVYQPSVAISPPQATPSYSRIGTRNPVFSLYMSLSWMMGFREKYSLFLLFVFGGALVGYCLARSLLMNPGKMRSMTTPGEFFWFNIQLFRINYILHIYLTVLGGIFVGIQFLPMIRRKYVLLHRLNGYFVIITLVVGNIGGAIVARRSFGGEINAQSAYYILGIMTIVPLLIGLFFARRNTRLHRKWMLRAVVYFATVISGKLIILAANRIITNIGSFYSLWRCDEILFVLRSVEQLVEQFPECSTSGNTLLDPSFHVAVHASLNEGELGYASASRVTHGMALWIAALIHAIGIEAYLRYSEIANYERHNFALEPRDFDPEKDDSYKLRY